MDGRAAVAWIVPRIPGRGGRRSVRASRFSATIVPMAWRQWRVFAWLDSLDERYVPEKLQGQDFTEGQLKWVRRLMVASGVFWLFTAIGSAGAGRWPAVALQTAVAVAFIVGRKRYAAFLVRQAERGKRWREGGK
jgi:hypothetical protein